MDLSFTGEEDRFRDEVRTWIAENLPEQWRHGGTGGYRETGEEDLQRESGGASEARSSG